MDERPLTVQPTLCAIFGITRAVILQEIHWLLNQPRSGKIIERIELADGRVFAGARWIWNTAEQWKEFFPWLESSSIRKHISGLEDSRVLVSCTPGGVDRTKHYTIDYERFNEMAEASPLGNSCHMEKEECAASKRNTVSGLQEEFCATSSISQRRLTEKTSREDGADAPRASAPEIVVPDSLKNQPAPPRKPRVDKHVETNITESDDIRVTLYLENLCSEITTTNAENICKRVGMDAAALELWEKTIVEWSIGDGSASWNPTSFSGMFERYDRKVKSRAAQAKHGTPKARGRTEQPQQFGVGGEWYQAAERLGWDLTELTAQPQEAIDGN
jgi:hypothetical protein